MPGIAALKIRTMKHAMLIMGTGALISISASAPAYAQQRSSAPQWAEQQGFISGAEIREEIADRSGDLRQFYAARDNRPLWLSQDGMISPAVGDLLERVETAQFDGIEKKALRKLRTKSARRALQNAVRGDADDIAKADVQLSELFARYVQSMRAAPSDQMIYESEALAPIVPRASFVLEEAGKAPSLERYVRQMKWMHPLYAPLRDAMNSPEYTAAERRSIWQNLSRVRALPTMSDGRYVLVDTAGARLWMYEDGRPVDSMRVVVGKSETQTPTMAGFLRHAIINPYWNIPPDLVQQNIATNVLDLGTGYLKDRGYEVLSDYSDKPAVIDPKTVNWQEVAAGTRFVRVRQKPGGGNFMGKVKYEFPNPLGIYLHDTPDKHLLKEDIRQLSSGCVRLEDASQLGKWLLGKQLPRIGKKAEQRIDLPELVPVYITYFTAMPTDGGIAFRSDVYGLDQPQQLARLGD